MAADRTPAQVAQYDQDLDAASVEVRRLAGILKDGAAAAGEHQAMADVAALIAGSEPEEVAGLLMAALQQLAGLER
jgi:ethanolamine utilization microcompartment shell protein EutL